MASSIQYRQYMKECLRSAAKASSPEERKSLLQLAQTWHEAATNLETSARLAKESVAMIAVRGLWSRSRSLSRRHSDKGSAVPRCAEQSAPTERCSISTHLGLWATLSAGPLSRLKEEATK
jgi:hypothetical protein